MSQEKARPQRGSSPPTRARQERILAYHATTREAWAQIQADNRLKESDRHYDWLGRGVYFWQAGPARAWVWKVHQQLPKHLRATPDQVIVLEVELTWNPAECVDLLDIYWYRYLLGRAESIISFWSDSLGWDPDRIDRELQRNAEIDTAQPHAFDCRLIDSLCEDLFDLYGLEVRAVRGAFQHLARLYAHSAFRYGDHVQIAIRHPAMIDVESVAIVEGLDEVEPWLPEGLLQVTPNTAKPL
ncbi:MAG: hypothetical protein ACRDJH_07815 [Thermomicrobiales bacterium]